MKKNLLIAGLVLTIATSVISGTMAAYNTSIDLAKNTVVAKAFVLTAVKNTDSSAITAPKIAPGEEKEIRFTVDANSETGMDVVIKVDVTSKGNTISPLTYKLYAANDADTVLAESTDGQSFAYNDLTLAANGVLSQEYVLSINWPWGTTDGDDTMFQGKAHSNSVQITVSGTQTQTQP